MQQHIIGIIHPGEMGSFVAASAANSGQKVLWASKNRSDKTRQRAEKSNLIDAVSIQSLCNDCDMIFSVCPPHAAEDVAAGVLQEGFKGLYLDANAISPMRVEHIEQKLSAAGIQFVDGGIIGVPNWQNAKTRIYLSGNGAETVAECFSAGPLQAEVIGDNAGKASALKMCYAARTKGTTALISTVVAAAESLGVKRELLNEWSRDGSPQAAETVQQIRAVTAKAWRYSGEMREISATFDQAGLPGDFHSAAAEIYHRIRGFKDSASLPPLDDILAELIQKSK